MQALINFFRAIGDTFRVAFDREKKGKRRAVRRMPTCTSCGQFLYPEEMRTRICSDCVTAREDANRGHDARAH